MPGNSFYSWWWSFLIYLLRFHCRASKSKSLAVECKILKNTPRFTFFRTTSLVEGTICLSLCPTTLHSTWCVGYALKIWVEWTREIWLSTCTSLWHLCLQKPQQFVLWYDHSISFINPLVVFCTNTHVFCHGSSFISLLIYCQGPWFQMNIFSLMLDIGQLRLTFLLYLCIPNLGVVQSCFIPWTRFLTFFQNNIMQVSGFKKKKGTEFEPQK